MYADVHAEAKILLPPLSPETMSLHVDGRNGASEICQLLDKAEVLLLASCHLYRFSVLFQQILAKSASIVYEILPKLAWQYNRCFIRSSLFSVVNYDMLV